jgi:uncharacterized protein YrzB (UPF0473 family)
MGSHLLQAVEKSKECFDKLSMNGNFSGNSNLSPFVLSASKDSERFFNRLFTFDNSEMKKHSVNYNSTGDMGSKM